MVGYLEMKALDLIDSDCKNLVEHPVIEKLNLEKTGISDVTNLIKILPLISLHSLSLASTHLKPTLVSDLSKLIC